jgi:antitoxin (DNA-binding transcriptional repressor) of toxin-antitoxin stability system
MTTTINARELRRDLAHVVKQAQMGQRFRVLYRSRVAFEIVPPGTDTATQYDLQDDTMYGAKAVGASSDGFAARDHDQELYA